MFIVWVGRCGLGVYKYLLFAFFTVSLPEFAIRFSAKTMCQTWAYAQGSCRCFWLAGRTVGNRRGEERDPLKSLLLGFGWVGSFRASVPARVGACVIPKCFVRATLFVQCVMSGLALCAAFL